MPISENMVQEIVQEVMAKMQIAACDGTERCRCYRYSCCCRYIHGYLWRLIHRLIKFCKENNYGRNREKTCESCGNDPA